MAMTIDPKAYLAIEDSAARIVEQAVQSFARSAFSKIRKLVKKGQYTLAYKEAYAFELKDVFRKKVETGLREVFVGAILFGQQQLVPIQLTALTTGAMTLPPILDQAIQMYRKMVEVDLADMLREAMVEYIGQEELLDEVTPFSKNEDGELLEKATVIKAPEEVENYVKAGVSVRANLITTRLVNYGFLSQAKVSGVESYQISEVLDSRVCPVCRIMHGKKFSVGQQLTRLETAFSEADPEVLRQAMPWPKQTKAGIAELKTLTPVQISARGFDMPPFHPFCRGLLVKTGTTEEIVEIEDVTPVLPVPEPEPVAPIPASNQMPEMTPKMVETLIAKINDLPKHKTLEGYVLSGFPSPNVSEARKSSKITGDMDRLHAALDGTLDLPMQEIDFDDLVSFQPEVQKDRLLSLVAEPASSGEVLPLVLDLGNGRYGLEDGNHRATLLKLLGRKTLLARVLDDSIKLEKHEDGCSCGQDHD